MRLQMSQHISLQCIFSNKQLWGNSYLFALHYSKFNHISYYIYIYISFLYQGFLSRTLTSHRRLGERRGTILFHSTTSTRSRTFRHLFATLRVRGLPHIFNRLYLPDCYSMRFTTLSNNYLID